MCIVVRHEQGMEGTHVSIIFSFDKKKTTKNLMRVNDSNETCLFMDVGMKYDVEREFLESRETCLKIIWLTFKEMNV